MTDKMKVGEVRIFDESNGNLPQISLSLVQVFKSTNSGIEGDQTSCRFDYYSYIISSWFWKYKHWKWRFICLKAWKRRINCEWFNNWSSVGRRSSFEMEFRYYSACNYFLVLFIQYIAVNWRKGESIFPFFLD